MKFVSYTIIILFIVFSILIYLFYFNNDEVAIPLDNLIINYPRDLQEVSGIIKVDGVASDKYSEIYYRIDLSDWKLADGTNRWNFELDTQELSKGVHVIYVKADDKVKAVRIIVK